MSRRNYYWSLVVCVIAFFVAGQSRTLAQSLPPAQPAPKSAVEGKDGWGQIDQRLVFLTVELSTVESSITATNKALKANGYKLADLTSDAERAREKNVQMDRQGGGPVPWQQFYGRTARDFYYHPQDDNTVYVNPAPVDQRPPQFDYIYRANEDNRAKAEAAAAAVGTKIDDLLAHRKVLEGEPLSLWCKIAFRAVASRELSTKPLYRFDPVTSAAGDVSKQRLAAIKAGAEFVHAVDGAIAKAQAAVDADEKSSLDDLLHETTVVRADVNAKLLELPGIATDLADAKSPIGQFRLASKQLQDFAENMVDAYHTATGADVDADPARKSTSRGQFQQAISSYSEAVLAADASLTAAARAWSVTMDSSKAPAAPAPEAHPDATSIGAQLQAAKSENQAALLKARQALLATIDNRLNSAADAGDLQSVQSLQLVKTAAARDGTIPADEKDAGILSAKSTYDSAINSANEHLATAYQTAVREFTKARQFTEAQAAQDEFESSGLSATEGGPPPAAADLNEQIKWDDYFDDFVEAQHVASQHDVINLLTPKARLVFHREILPEGSLSFSLLLPNGANANGVMISNSHDKDHSPSFVVRLIKERHLQLAVYCHDWIYLNSSKSVPTDRWVDASVSWGKDGATVVLDGKVDKHEGEAVPEILGPGSFGLGKIFDVNDETSLSGVKLRIKEFKLPNKIQAKLQPR